MAPRTIENPTVTIEVTRRFAAPPDQLFDAWLDPERAAKFLFATPGGKMVRVEIDGRTGGHFTITERWGDEDVEHIGTYIEVTRPRRLAFGFGVPKYTAETTRVAVSIEPAEDPGESILTLTHQGVWADYADKTKQGWVTILDTLAGVLD